MKHLLTIVINVLCPLALSAQSVPMDYSFCGYQHSEQDIPLLPTVVTVTPTGGDDSRQLQAAIDLVSRRKPDKATGLRGAVLLGEGTFVVAEALRLHTPGVVLRGSGRDKTVLRKTGYDRGAAVYIEGNASVSYVDTIDVAADVAAGTQELPLGGLTVGSQLVLWRPSTQQWIEALDCASFGGGKRMGYWAWHPGDIDLRWHRTVTAAANGSVTLDAPLTCSTERRNGGLKAIVCRESGLVSNCGIENLTLESDYDRSLPMDENHCWDGVYIAAATDCWVRMVDFRHFAGSAVVVQKSARQVTVEDCQSFNPVSEIGGFRRRTFLTFGEMVLFQRCWSEHGINDFAVGHTAAGPNAFVQCESYESFGPSGAIGSWAPGVLFDIVNIDGNDLWFGNWGLEKFGAGWSTAASIMWQSTASALYCQSPDTLNRNCSHGCWGQINGNGEYTQMNEHVRPYSLFRWQLEKRVGDNADARCRVLERNTNASSSPSIEEAMKMSAEARQPRQTLQQWIQAATLPGSSAAESGNSELSRRASVTSLSGFSGNSGGSRADYCVQGGWLTKDGAVLVGGKHQTPWWNGRTTTAAMDKAQYALTRFVPGYEGNGGTDRIDSVVARMKRDHTLLFSQNYGLWTDRRRDDHERIRRKNGDAWAPFYEQPFARTGRELAWDGMTKYDLTQLNRWYFWRLREFAEKTSADGLLLKNQHYFQHNILEAGAHWVDCPWRTANNVNGTPFAEPVNFTGDKRIFVAEQFYDIGNPALRQLHRQYIRQSLDAFKGVPNVIHSIGEEFTGPLHFVQFWLDVIREWESENGRVLVALAVNKDVQDSILADPVRSAVVDIIDIEQWFYHSKGEYAPPGGVNMAQRQYMRKIRTGSARFEDVYRAVSEYRTRFPGKAVVYSAQKYPEMCWASLMAGGSCAAVPALDASVLTRLTAMTPRKSGDCYLLQGDAAMLVYSESDSAATIPLGNGVWTVSEINPRSGAMKKLRTAKGSLTISGKGVYWLSRK